MAEEHYVIIGNGITANRAADVIRKGDHESRITLISDEFFPLYYRHLLCDFLIDKKTEAELVVRPPAYYKEHNIRLRLGQKVVKADLSAKTLYLKHMEKIHYSKLLLATGGKPKIPETYFEFKDCFTTLKTLSDAREIKGHLANLQKVLILGGDLISVKVAKALLAKNIKIYFLLNHHPFWPLDLSEKDKSNLVKSLTDMGITVMSDDPLTKVKKTENNHYTVTTKSGSKFEVNMIGAFFGLAPDVSFLLGSGLDLERGIIVNEYLQTNVPDVFAAGDCAQVYNPQISNYWVSMGWPNAERLGEIAGHNILGESLKTEEPQKSIINLDGIKISTSWWKEFNHAKP